MKELIDFIATRLYYHLFVRPRAAAKVAPEWDINLPNMEATYQGPQAQPQFSGITMTFYLAADGKGGQNICGGLNTIPAEAQTALDNMTTRRSKQFLRRITEEGDRVFRAAWRQSAVEKQEGGNN
jgi:hypothetical protein